MERKLLLNKLIDCNGDLNDISKELSKFSWDSQNGLVHLKKDNIKNVLRRYLEGSLSNQMIEHWANLIEMREDVRATAEINEIIHLLANPILYEPISKNMVKQIIDGLCKESD